MGENKEGRGQSLRDRIRNDFTYHPPGPTKARRHEVIRTILQRVAGDVVDLVPAGREQSLALTKLEEAMFWANAGIARHTFDVAGADVHFAKGGAVAMKWDGTLEPGDPGPPQTERLVGKDRVEVSITAFDAPSIVDAVMAELDRRRRMEPLR